MKRFILRKVHIDDIPKLNELYRNTILTVNRKDYTLDEVEDWASCGNNNMERWYELLKEQYYIMAECEGLLVGFGSINDVGYMHTLFVHKDFQEQGIASLLYEHLENYAQEKGAERITSEVSITAKPFFEKRGFQVDEVQQRRANRLYLTNYKMSKWII